MMRAPVTVATAIAGAFVFQGCKNDDETQSQQVTDDTIKSYQDLIKTDHTTQQCRDVQKGKFVDTSGAEFTGELAVDPAFKERIDALRKDCLTTANDAVKKGSETAQDSNGFSRSGASGTQAIATPPKKSSTADEDDLLNQFPVKPRVGTREWFDEQNRSPHSPGVRGAVVTVSTTAHRVSPNTVAVTRHMHVQPISTQVQPQPFFVSDVDP